MDLAKDIVASIFPDLTHAPEKFGQVAYKGYTFQVERLARVMEELKPFHADQYAETEKYRAGIPMLPDYDAMMEREYAGGLIQFTSRTAAGELVGHMRVYLSQSSHTQTLIATEDTLYVTPAHRGGFMAARLWRFAEESVLPLGVREIYFDAKLSNKSDSMARYMKYQPVATRFAKIITDPEKE